MRNAEIETRRQAAMSRGVGVLSREDAVAYGVVGPIARASGLAIDVRQDFSYAAYEELGFKIVTQDTCDVMARVVVRALEMLESCRLIEKALLELPGGPLRPSELVTVIPAGEAVARVEAPRGEVVYYLKSDGSDTPVRVKIRTPSDLNIPSVRAMARGQFETAVDRVQRGVRQVGGGDDAADGRHGVLLTGLRDGGCAGVEAGPSRLRPR